MKNSICIFTSRFPFGKSETFIEPELKLLSTYYKTIHIFPLLTGKMELERDLPDNIIIHSSIPILVTEKMDLLNLRMWFDTLNEFLHCRNIFFLRNLRKQLLIYIQCKKRSEKLMEEHSMLIHNSDLYVYWMEDWATTLSLTHKKKSEFRFLSRVHGYDLFDERNELGFIPWRNLQLKHVKYVVAVSKAGQDYLKKKFPEYAEKIKISHLGTVGDNLVLMPPNDSEIIVVSCSTVIGLKRVEEIALHLLALKKKMNWIHFGDGDELNNLKKLLIEKQNGLLQIELKGNVNRKDILAFYAKTPVDIFIHLSESEGGVPIAIQEAISFGIPVLACDAGGVNEIINKQTGFLLDINFSESEFESAINYLFNHCSRNFKFRSEIIRYWKENFDFEKNTQKFIGYF